MDCVGNALGWIFTIDSREEDPYIGCEAEVTIRFSNSQCSRMTRPVYCANPLRPVVGVSRSAKQVWINHHGGTLDSGKESEAP